MTRFQPSVSLMGRILLSVIFVVSGLGKIADWSHTAAYMTSQGMPAVPVFLTLAILIELVGGLALMFGWHTRIAALVLFLYLVPVTLTFHSFWALAGPERQLQMTNFLKNLAIMGGLLEFCAVGAYAMSLDAMRYRRGWFGFRRWMRRPY
jgi:putative oxidoreductase